MLERQHHLSMRMPLACQLPECCEDPACSVKDLGLTRAHLFTLLGTNHLLTELRRCGPGWGQVLSYGLLLEDPRIRTPCPPEGSGSHVAQPGQRSLWTTSPSFSSIASSRSICGNFLCSLTCLVNYTNSFTETVQWAAHVLEVARGHRGLSRHRVSDTDCCSFLQMNTSARDHATPVFLMRNCAGHLPGCLRTIGAVVVGQLGGSGHKTLLLGYIGHKGLVDLPDSGGRQEGGMLGMGTGSTRIGR